MSDSISIKETVLPAPLELFSRGYLVWRYAVSALLPKPYFSVCACGYLYKPLTFPGFIGRSETSAIVTM